MGVFFLFMGLDKTCGSPSRASDDATARVARRRARGEPVVLGESHPGAPVFARLVPAGELAVGVAFIAGIQVRLAAVAGLFMVLNFHFAMGVLLRYSYLWNGYGPPVLGSLVALAIGGARLPFSVTLDAAR